MTTTQQVDHAVCSYPFAHNPDKHNTPYSHRTHNTHISHPISHTPSRQTPPPRTITQIGPNLPPNCHRHHTEASPNQTPSTTCQYMRCRGGGSDGFLRSGDRDRDRPKFRRIDAEAPLLSLSEGTSASEHRKRRSSQGHEAAAVHRSGVIHRKILLSGCHNMSFRPKVISIFFQPSYCCLGMNE